MLSEMSAKIGETGRLGNAGQRITGGVLVLTGRAVSIWVVGLFCAASAVAGDTSPGAKKKTFTDDEIFGQDGEQRSGDSYICIASNRIGFHYSDDEGEADPFHHPDSDNKYVIKRVDGAGTPWAIKYLGHDTYGGVCPDGFTGDGGAGVEIECRTLGDGIFHMNRELGRFMFSHPMGFIAGKGKPAPQMEVGECSKI